MRSRVARPLRNFYVRPCGRSSAIRWTDNNIRPLHVQATPSSTNPTAGDIWSPRADIAAPTDRSSPDVRFEVLGPSSSLLSVTLSASQNLFFRRGTLVGVQGTGNSDDAMSTPSPLSPIRRAPFGIPWLYHRMASTSPMSLLIGAGAVHTSFAVLNLDGRRDWMVSQRSGLLAWSGENLSARTAVDRRFGLAYWGQTLLTGRGIAALAGTGNVYQITLNDGERYIAHPRHVLAYSVAKPPLPYRFKTSALPLRIPNLGASLPNVAFLQGMRQTRVFKVVGRILSAMRTWMRRTIFGDRLFMRFEGPTTLLLQSRGSRSKESLTNRDINEIADTPAGGAQEIAASKLGGEVASGLYPSNSQVPSAHQAQASGSAAKTK